MKVFSLIGDSQRQGRFQSTLMDCVQTLYMSGSADEAINKLLEIIADYYKSELTYILEFEPDLTAARITYEWCGGSITPKIGKRWNVGKTVISRWISGLSQNDEMFIDAMSEDLPEDADAYNRIRMQNISSLLAAPLRSGGEIVGVIGAADPKDNTDSLILLRMVAAFAANDMQKRETLEQRILKTIGNTFVSMNMINLRDNTQQEIKRDECVAQYVNRPENAVQQMQDVMNALTNPEYRSATLEFSDLRTLNERMKNDNVLSHEFLASDGHWCRGGFLVMNRDKEGNVIDVIFVVQYIDAEKKREIEYQRALKKALENQNEIYAEMLHMQGCGVLACRADDARIILMNDAAQKLLGIYDEEALISEVLKPIISDNLLEIRDKLRAIRDELGTCEFEFAVESKEYGGIVYVKSNARTVLLDGGEKIMILTLMDITDKKNLENRLIELSQTDALTRISNRGSGERRTEELIQSGTKGMFCLMDIDKFKYINDSFGHVVGDKALIALADCLRASFGGGDVIMRLGGDEFAVFAADVLNEEQGALRIERLFEAVEQINIPEMYGSKITISLGAVLCPDRNMRFDELYPMADSAMYLCKETPGNQYSFSGSCNEIC